MRAVCLVALASCAVSLPVPLEPAPITKPPGKRPYEKAGVPLDRSCGERFELAVTGVDEAERDVRACHVANDVAIAGWLGALVLGMTSTISAEDHQRGGLLDAEIGVAVTSFIIGEVAAFIVVHRQHRAIDEYNAAVTR
jgi:hypothetical protein